MDRAARRIPLVVEYLLALALTAALSVIASGAPQKSPALVGPLESQFNSPVVTIPDDGEPRTYWLVFPDPAVEVQVLKLAVGTRVAVFGRVCAGGAYRYVIVTAIHPDE